VGLSAGLDTEARMFMRHKIIVGVVYAASFESLELWNPVSEIAYEHTYPCFPVLSCVGRCLSMGLFPVRGVLPSLYA
jgi:hypothetical protein